MRYRLKQLRKALGLTQAEFGKEIGISDVAVSYMESGRTAISDQNLHLICLTFKVREAWLRDGSGVMIDEEALLAADEKLLLDLFRKMSRSAQRLFIEYAKKLLSDEQTLRGEALEAAQNAPGGAAKPLKTPERAKGEESTDKEINPIHSKKRG
jgi:transcriptional regulator with XRE-family HTH domain